MKRPPIKAGYIVGIAALLFVGFFAYEVWVTFLYNVDFGSWSTRGDVTECTSVPPPPEASDIRVAMFSHGQARNTFVRFRAPVDVCLKYATLVAHNMELKPLDGDQVLSDLDNLCGYCNLSGRDLCWFDLPYAQSYWIDTEGGVRFHRPDYQNLPAAKNIVGADPHADSDVPFIRVDVSRGIFYFYTIN